MKPFASRLLVGFTILVIASACSGAAGPGPSGPGSSPPITIDSPDAATARVLAVDARFAGIKPFDPNLIGQCCFSRAEPAGDGYAVTIQVGWGDCPAGCIDRHQWVFDVSRTGDVTLRTESGPAVPAGLPGAASAGASGEPGPSGSGELGLGSGVQSGIGIDGVATAGPTCPVVKPGDPACKEKPVAGATIHIVAADGTEVATLTTDANGRFSADLEPGQYQVRADDVPGLMHRPDPVVVTVTSKVEVVQLSYDTGIR